MMKVANIGNSFQESFTKSLWRIANIEKCLIESIN